jgi:tetratricopeptide (TPR) repeat protein
VDKPTQWSLDAMAKWYGQTWRPHYGQILQAGRDQKPEAAADLASLASDRLYPTIVRATALAELAPYGGDTAHKAYAAALLDEESLMRQTAVRHLPERDPARRLKLLVPMLYDPVRGVRIEAAGAVAELHPDSLPTDVRQQFDQALAEYRHAMERTADFAASRHNLGNLERSLGHYQKAVEQYQKAIAIDDQFYPAKVNLAMLYNQLGRNGEAERLLKEVVQQHPDLYELQYSLGLLLAEQNRLEEAAVYLRQAAAGLPQRSRIHYNLGLLVQRLNRDNEAQAALQTALVLEPDNPDYIYALAVFYLERGNREKAREMAEKLMAVNPGSPAGRQLLKIIEQNKGD